jgi:hypothetical protein
MLIKSRLIQEMLLPSTLKHFNIPPGTEKQKLKYTKLYNFYLLFCMGVKCGLMLRKVCKLNVFENRLLKEIFGPTREERLDKTA